MIHEESIKTTLIGAAVGAGIGMLLGRSVTESAVVGGGVGLVKSLFFSEHSAGGHLAGAPPPGGDYSFTRRPGFNDKNY